MRISPQRKSEQAIALIIVMIVILVLSAIAFSFALAMKTEIRLARHASNDEQFEWVGRSGVELARCILSKQMENTTEQYDSLKQRWAGGIGNTNDALADIPMTDFELGSNASFSITIVDAERKFNINIADQRILDSAMNVIGVDAGTSPMIRDSILDWIDRDKDERLSGAETDYYERLNPAYFAKNGWIDDMSELLKIRGIIEDPAIFWGGSVTNHGPSIYQRNGHNLSMAREDSANYPVGLNDLFTCLGGKININTASNAVLQMIPGIDSNVVTMITGAFPGRAGPDGVDGTEDDTPFMSIQDLNGRNIPGLGVGAAANFLNQYLYVRSRVFEVHVTCKVSGEEREYVSVLDRLSPRDIKVLYAYWAESQGTAQVSAPAPAD